MSFSTKTIRHIHQITPIAVLVICCLMVIWAFKAGAFALAAFFGVIMLQALGFLAMLFISSMRAAWSSTNIERG